MYRLQVGALRGFDQIFVIKTKVAADFLRQDEGGRESFSSYRFSERLTDGDALRVCINSEKQPREPKPPFLAQLFGVVRLL